MDKTPDVLTGISKQQAGFFFRAGHPMIGNVVLLMRSECFWYDKVSGIGPETGKRIVWVFAREKLIDRECEAYKLATDRAYYREKWVQMIEAARQRRE